MKRTLLLAACLLATSAGVSAQDDAQYQTWMKVAAAASGSLRKDLDAKSGVTAGTDARKLEDVFGQVAAYWQSKNVSDATKFAQDAQAAFRQVADLSNTGKFDEASEALKTAQATCTGCHNSHREKAPDGSFTMK